MSKTLVTYHDTSFQDVVVELRLDIFVDDTAAREADTARQGSIGARLDSLGGPERGSL
jgi:hypothetical protein